MLPAKECLKAGKPEGRDKNGDVVFLYRQIRAYPVLLSVQKKVKEAFDPTNEGIR